MSPRHSLADVEPTFRNRLDAHTKDVGVAVVSVCLGLLVIVGGLQGNELSNLPVARMPDPLVYSLGALIVAGGALSAVGLLVTRTLIDKEYRTERTGEIFLFFGWAAYTVATSYYTDGELGSIVIGVVFALCSAWRFRVVGRIERSERVKRELEKRAARGRTP